MAAASRNLILIVPLVLVVGGGGIAWWWSQREQPIDMIRVLELNNRGIGYMDQFDYPKAVTAFRETVQVAPRWVPGRINLGIALLNDHKNVASLEEAIALFEKVLQEEPTNNHAEFCLGILKMYHAKEMAVSVAHFKRVTQRDPDDPHAWFFMAGILYQTDDLKQATECYERVVALDPNLLGSLYNLFLIYGRSGKAEAAEKLLERFKELQKASWENKAATKYSEMGKYAEPIGRNPRENAPTTGPLPIFVRDPQLKVQLAKDTRWATAADFGAGAEAEFARAVRKRFGGAMVVVDCNRDGKLDLFLAGAVVRAGILSDLLLLNAGNSTFRDVTLAAGLGVTASYGFGIDASFGCCVGDFDNDGLPDLLLTGPRGVRLMRNAGEKEVRFQDVSTKAGLNDLTGVCLGAAFSDIDQEGDLDVLIALAGDNAANALAALNSPSEKTKGGSVVVFRNIGEATPVLDPKTIVPLTAKFERADQLLPGINQASLSISVSDLDTDRDIDVAICPAGAAPFAILNDRLSKFRRVALPEKAFDNTPADAMAVIDINRDEKSDLFAIGAGRKCALLVQGKAGGESWFSAGVTNAPAMIQAQAVDIDLDGWPDIVGLSEERVPVLLHNEAGKLIHVKEALGASGDWPKDAAAMIASDIDGRCYIDLLLWSEAEGLRLYRNQGNGNQGLPVSVTGRRVKGDKMRTNSDGIGVRVGVQVRDHWTCAEMATFHAGLGQSRQPILFGLGKHSRADFVSLRWPDGLWQAELNLSACQRADLAQTDRRIDSCPLLFTWNGERFVYITDFLGAGSIGEPLPGGGNRPPRPEESIKIEAEQLVAKDGRYVLKFAEPMNEVTYLDRLRLLVVDYPPELHSYPDERFQSETRPATQDLLVYSQAQQVFANQAKDHRGRDITSVLRHWDRNTADGFAKRSWTGFAEEHWVELDFGDQLAKFDAKQSLTMFLAGWTDYPYPESIWAAAQAGRSLLSPVLERLNVDGKWEEVRSDLTFPAGLPRMMTYDITGLVAGPTCKLRIRTNMHVYWDQIFIAPLTERLPNGQDTAKSVRLQTLHVTDAMLVQRGCPQEYTPDGKAPTMYAYDKLEAVAVTRQTGKLTRFGNVTPLLTDRDDRFVIFGPGDELSVNFAADRLPPLPAGWKRSFVLRTWGYCKDANPWTATGETIEPLPFGAMSNFPYGPGERYPQSPLHEEYLRRWQTRHIGR